MAEAGSSGTLEVTVVSPARPIFEGEAKFVTAPAWDMRRGRPLALRRRPRARS